MHFSLPRHFLGGIGVRAVLALAMLAIFQARLPAQGLSTGSIPSPGYHAIVEMLYRGEYQRALRGFNSEVNGAIKTVQARWIDSICYHAMLGETYYQLGRNREALSEFDQACELYLAYPDWLLRVKFQQQPQPDTNRAQFLVPWGRTTRQVSYGRFPDTMLVAMGRLDHTAQVRQGGVISLAQFWKLNVFELVRTTSLAIRRRNELLGPLAKHDRISRELVTVLAKGGIAPANHWSNSLVELQLGLAQSAMENPQEALTHLSRGVLIDGRYDYPLTGVALLAQGMLAKEAGNLEVAANLFSEAGIAAYAFEDWDIVSEALWQGHLAHMAMGGRGPYAPLEAASAWSSRAGFDHLTMNFRLAQAEGLLVEGDVTRANSIVQAVPRRRDLQAGLLGIRQLHLQALIAFTTGQDESGEKSLAQALARQMAASIRNFQIAKTAELIQAGTYTSRVAVGVFAALLQDPTPAEWTFQPLEMIAVLMSDHQNAYDRWFLASLDRKEINKALEISELAKRRRFFAAQPLGGRLVALRHVLQSPETVLSREAILQRKGLAQRFPEYSQLSAEAQALRQELDGGTLFDKTTGKLNAQPAKRVGDWSTNAQQRESLLRQIALRREPVTMAFPPQRTTEELQTLLEPGQALVVVHQAGESLFAFLVTNSGVHAWQLPQAGPLRLSIARLQREIGNFNGQRTVTAAELVGSEWREEASQIADMLFANSKLELSATKELIFVPDGPLWYVPFEALPVASSGGVTLLVDAAPLRYAPTAGLAVGDKLPLRPVNATAIVLPAATASTAPATNAVWQRLSEVVEGPIRVSGPLSVDSALIGKVFDQIVSTIESEVSSDANAWAPLPLDRASSAGTLARWEALPYQSPERMLLTGVRLSPEMNSRPRRRASGSRGAPASREGDELFQAACGLFSAGARTLLLTRWQTGGAVQEAIVREFASEMTDLSAAEAWQRSTRLARAMPLDPNQEPHFKHGDDTADLPTADHPFFWAGFVLFDTGRDPREIDAEPKEEAPAVAIERPVAPTETPMPPPPPVPPQPDSDASADDEIAEPD